MSRGKLRPGVLTPDAGHIYIKAVVLVINTCS